jgi:DNA polymerase
MEVASFAVRGAIIAPPGRKLVIADLSNIEGRVLAWLAGEGWKLDAFRAYDAGTGPDLYKLAYARSFGIAPDEVTKDGRQIGKVMELSLGYEGGVGAFVTMAAGYGLDLDALAAAAWPTLPGDIVAEAEDMLRWQCAKAFEAFDRRVAKDVPRSEAQALLDAQLDRVRLGLSERVWLTCDSLKRLWRYAHPATAGARDAPGTGLWRTLEAEAIRATLDPSRIYGVGRMTVRRTDNWLRVRLPSGRNLCYASPRVEEDGKLSYMGLNQYSRRWERLRTYGGKLVENATQAAARDVMAAAMPRVEAAGYEIVLTVHDELVTETPDRPEFNAEHLADLLATNPPWAEGLPLAAAGFEAYRYRKG